MARTPASPRAGEQRLSLAGSSRLLGKFQTEVLEHIEAQSLAAAIPEPPRTAHSGWLATALVTWITVAALLAFNPPLVSGPVAHAFVTAPAQREASLRYGIWLANGAVQRFIARSNRLPSFLGETGYSDRTIQMRVTGSRSYELVGTEGETALTLPSNVPADAFLGESVRTLRGY